MYKKFDITTITTNLLDKRITINFSMDVDESTLSKNTIILSNSETEELVDYTIEHRCTAVDLIFTTWPIPNSNYVLIIQKGIMSVTEDELGSALKRSLIFDSEITSLVNILSPSQHEEINAINLKWLEETSDGALPVDSYYIEIAKENVFYNIVLATTVIDKSEILLEELEDGQYFVRIRAEKNGQYGKWSEVVSFVYKAPDRSQSDDDIIYEQELGVLTKPANGETPSTFLIEFDDDIDYEDIEIVLLRRDI